MTDIQDQISRMREFFEAVYQKEVHEIFRTGKKFLNCDFSQLAEFDPDLAEELLTEPEEIFKVGELGLQALELPLPTRVRFFNLPLSQKVKIRDIRAEHLGKFIAIDGIVRQSSDVRPQVVMAKFECPSCGNLLTIPQTEQIFKEPHRCSCGKSGKFRLVNKDLVDTQRLVLEEAPEALTGGEQPKRLSVFLREDLVEPKMEKRTTPGAKILVTAVVKEIPVPSKTGAQSTRYDLAAEANHIMPVEETYDDITISPEDEQKIKGLAEDPKIYEQLIKSIAPSIYGHEDIKGALVLQLMGGIRKERSDGTAVKGDIHILLVGDPGAAKSTFLTFMQKTAPKARYIAGRGASAAGITATVVKDEFLRGYALEAGAIVLANNGFLLLDEMDKMSTEDTSALHEAMAQQSYHFDTEILFADGSVKKIGEFVDRILDGNLHMHRIGDCEVVGITGKEILTTNFSDIYPTAIHRVSRHKAPKKFVEITYSNGRKIIVTPEHPVFIYQGGISEIPAQSVKEGMLAPAPRSLPTTEKNPILVPVSTTGSKRPISFPHSITPAVAAFLGYWITEGYSYLNTGYGQAEIGICNTDPRIHAEVFELFTESFNTSPQQSIRLPLASNRATLPLTTARVGSIPLHTFLSSNFSEAMTKAPEKRVGNVMKRMSRELQLSFLRAAFQGDGTVDCSRIGFRTASLGLAKDYQDMLLQQGIYSRIESTRSAGRIYYRVTISGSESFERFFRTIVDPHDRRLRKIQQIVERSLLHPRDHDCIPFEVMNGLNNLLRILGISDGHLTGNQNSGNRAHIKTITRYIKKIETTLCAAEKVMGNTRATAKEIREALNITAKDIASNVPRSTYYYRERNGIISLTKVRAYAIRKLNGVKQKLEPITRLIRGNIRFLSVKRVRVIPNTDQQWVYDVTVEPTKTFISEGLVLHNTITIAKANIQATLNARTTVLAAANPKFGRFDPYKPIAAQINLPPALINRFDLIFPVRDLPSKDTDTRIATHILEMHRDPTSQKSEIPEETIKKYVAYVRQMVFPKLSNEAIDEIKEFYVTLRNQPSVGTDEIKPIPISARQLEALIRLAEGSARVRLSKKVTRQDAKNAISILKHCLMQVGFDYETKQFDVDRISTGIPASTRNKMSQVQEIINAITQTGKKAIPIEEIVSEAAQKNITEAQVEEIIDKLKREGDIYEPRAGWISKM